MEVKKSDLVIELTEAGLEQIRVYADSPRQREQALRLLVRVSPELRALERALREPK
ncbi:MAG TPA: hypothetical protein VIH46_08015 [Candidatus Acidoferrales bacterium]